MIQPPNFEKNAVPTPQGWRHPRTNELLLARKISQVDIDEYNNVEVTQDILYNNIESEVEDDIMIEQLNEAPVNNKSLNDMSKLELQEIAAFHGIEFKTYDSKSKLISLIEDKD